MNKFIIFLSFLGLAYGSHFLEGSWVEDQYQRENLWNFMSYRGVNYLKMVYANSASFELEQEISKDGNTFTFSGIRKFLRYFILNINFISHSAMTPKSPQARFLQNPSKHIPIDTSYLLYSLTCKIFELMSALEYHVL